MYSEDDCLKQWSSNEIVKNIDFATGREDNVLLSCIGLGHDSIIYDYDCMVC